jgi:hypothetical protein
MRQAVLLCRYANQDFFRIMGKEPPMTPLDRAVFTHCLIELYNNEVAPPKEPPPDTDHA